MRTIPIFIVGAAVVVLAFGAQSKRSNRPQGKPGVFDYYVLSLSWSPQHCADPGGKRDIEQCGNGKRYGFVVHGLWPQYERGFPDSCAAGSQVAPGIVTRLLPLMPSSRLIQHEWDKHGTCSGLSQVGYFETIEKTFAGLRVPDDFKTPLKQVMVKPDTIRNKFVAANPGFSAQSVKVLCGGRFLSEVRVCLTKDLKPRPCSTGVRDSCRADEIIMRPVR
jgi:ribonuclease T2